MKIEEGKYYRTRDGRKVGPMTGRNFKWVKGSGDTYDPTWQNDGRGNCDAPDLVAEWTDEPKLWRDMTPEEKGALLLAEHEGKVIECWNVEGWWADDVPYWFDDCAYRIRPEREMVTANVLVLRNTIETTIYNDATHRITFDTVDGEPDCASVRMEKIK